MAVLAGILEEGGREGGRKEGGRGRYKRGRDNRGENAGRKGGKEERMERKK